jgi:hypothetical protein
MDRSARSAFCTEVSMAVTHVHHVPNPGTVSIAPLQGQFLFFRVSAVGPNPRFRFASDIKGTLLNQGTFPQDPARSYEWTYLRDPSDVQQFELLSVAFLFAANAQYRYQVGLHGPGGKISDVIDIEYTGGVTDFDTELFRVLIV